MPRFAFWKSFLILSATAGASAGQAADPQVEIRTNLGLIVVELYRSKTPDTVDNFLRYVSNKHYDGTIFHRVIGSFMIQGGGFSPDYRQKSTAAPVRNEAQKGVEAGLKNTVGTIAMARTSDPQSATAQFFINLADNDFLNWGDARGDGHGYAVFGKVVSGMDTVNQIAKTPTGSAGPFRQDVPTSTVVIEQVTLVGAR